MLKFFTSPQQMKSKAKITITRNLKNQNQIYTTITNKIRKVVEIRVTPEQLALALTGLGYQDYEIESEEKRLL